MSFFDTARLALGNVRASKMRTFLTMLGIIIGVSSVIIIVGLGNGMQTYMESAFDSLGTNAISVVISGRGSSRSVSVDKMYEIKNNNPDCIEDMSPLVSMTSTVKVGTEELSSSVTGVSEDYLKLKGYELQMGRNLEYMDIKERNNVCVVGAYVNQTFYSGRALNQKIKVGSNSLTIVGIIEQQDDEMKDGGTDDCLLLPYSTATRFNGVGKITKFTYTTTNVDLSDKAVTAIEDALFEVFEDDDAYTVLSMAQLLDTFTSLLNVLITILAIIAGISLVVGGIGIMNIMLVSVTERTREIGIRKALGAKEGIILQQFVTEAAITSVLGGICGIVFGSLLCSVATKLVVQMLDVDMVITPSASAVLIAVGVSAGIGILFGYLPARKAANLNPIDALRYE